MLMVWLINEHLSNCLLLNLALIENKYWHFIASSFNSTKNVSSAQNPVTDPTEPTDP